MLNNKQINNNIEWLLEHASLPVKYLTHIHLLGRDPKKESMRELFDKVENSDIVNEIFSKQELDGSWCSGGSWALPPSYQPKSGYTSVSPKYVTTSWILPLLGDMGFTILDARIKKACEYILSHQLKNGFIPETYSSKYEMDIDQLPSEPCRYSIILIALAKVGAWDDTRVKKAFEVLLQWQQKDGGWVSGFHKAQKKWTRSCPYATYHAAMALYSANSNLYKNELKNALEFLLWHLSTKKENEIQSFFYHGHSIVQELLIFSENNIGLENPVIQTLLNWLMAMYQAEKNYFKYSGKAISKFSMKNDYMDSRVAKYRLFHLIEDDWLTYYLTLIFKNFSMYISN